MLATLAVLKGLGVGDDSATPLAAAITWLLRGEQFFNRISTLLLLQMVLVWQVG